MAAVEPRERITPLAAGFAAGISLGLAHPQWPWWHAAPVTVALAALAIAARRGIPWVAARRVPGAGAGAAMALLVAAAAALGVTWSLLRTQRVAPGALAAWMDDEPRLVRLRGTALDPPEVSEPHGVFARFDPRPPASIFRLRVEAVLGRGGDVRPAHGIVMVRVEEVVAPFSAGALVEASGMLRALRAPGNPGEIDQRREAFARGVAGRLSVPRRQLVCVTQEPRGAASRARSAFLAWREQLRSRAEAWLLADLAPAAGGAMEMRRVRDALLLDLLLGRRSDPALRGLQDQVRRAGLAHAMAISGMHLAVLAGVVLVAARVSRLGPRAQGLIVCAVVAAYLLMVDARAPVLRAGIMALLAGLGLAAGRRYQIGGLVAGSALVLLAWRPTDLLNPGFQLSFGVVLVLVHLAPKVRERWFGPPDAMASSAGAVAADWLRTAWASSVAAWVVAAPIAIYHWQTIWPWGVPATVASTPLVTIVLALGYAKMMVSAVLPSAGFLLGLPLAFATDALIAMVAFLAALPAAAIAVPAPSVAWAIGAVAWAAAALHGGIAPRTGRGKALLIAGAVLAGWLLWPLGGAAAGAGRGPLRVDMLDVGDGSCIVVRSAGHAVVFDAGSQSAPGAGRRRIVPALRHLGIRFLDAIVISHANLDHYSAVPDIVEALAVARVVVTPQLLREAARDPVGPVGVLLDAIAAEGVEVATAAAGESWTVGASRWRWLHPTPSASFEGANDSSMVIRVEAAGRALLLCGDIQADAMEVLAASGEVLDADVLEIPHHGGHHANAETFLAAVGPRVVMQSCGWSRWQRTGSQWTAAGAGLGRTWLVSARDGAVTVEVFPDGRIETSRFRHTDGISAASAPLR